MMKPAFWNYSNWWGSIANCWLLKDENSHDLPSYPPLRFNKIPQLSGQPDPVPTLTMRSTKEPPWGAPALVVRVWMPRVSRQTRRQFSWEKMGCFLMRILRSRSKYSNYITCNWGFMRITYQIVTPLVKSILLDCVTTNLGTGWLAKFGVVVLKLLNTANNLPGRLLRES